MVADLGLCYGAAGFRILGVVFGVVGGEKGRGCACIFSPTG